MEAWTRTLELSSTTLTAQKSCSICPLTYGRSFGQDGIGKQPPVLGGKQPVSIVALIFLRPTWRGNVCQFMFIAQFK